MKLGILADPHGNSLALRHVLEKINEINVDVLVCLGDVVGYFPEGLECLNLLREAGCLLVQGNHEAMLGGLHDLDESKDRIYGLSAQRNSMSQKDVSFLGGLSPRLPMEVDGIRILFVHGTPQDPLWGRLYPNDPWEIGMAEGFDVVFMGHTHRQCLFPSTEAVAVNVGSCGLSRDIGSLPGFCLFDTRNGEVELLRTEVDPAAVAEAYPGVHPAVLEALARNEAASAVWRVI